MAYAGESLNVKVAHPRDGLRGAAGDLGDHVPASGEEPWFVGGVLGGHLEPIGSVSGCRRHPALGLRDERVGLPAEGFTGVLGRGGYYDTGVRRSDVLDDHGGVPRRPSSALSVGLVEKAERSANASLGLPKHRRVRSQREDGLLEGSGGIVKFLENIPDGGPESISGFADPAARVHRPESTGSGGSPIDVRLEHAGQLVEIFWRTGQNA
jgi:hypothetical protein